MISSTLISGHACPLISHIVNPQGAHAAIQMAAIDAHQFGRARNVAAGFLDFPLDELAMIGVAGFLEGWKTIRGCGRLGVAESRQIFDVDSIVLVHDYDALDGVAQFAYIARP